MELTGLHISFLVLLLLLFHLFSSLSFDVFSNQNDEDVNRSQYPSGFLFGTSTSSYQATLLLQLLLFIFTTFFFFGYVLSLCYRLKEGILKMARASAIGMFSLTFKVNLYTDQINFFTCGFIQILVAHFPGKIVNNNNGDVADDHYHRFLVNELLNFFTFILLTCKFY